MCHYAWYWYHPVLCFVNYSFVDILKQGIIMIHFCYCCYLLFCFLWITLNILGILCFHVDIRVFFKETYWYFQRNCNEYKSLMEYLTIYYVYPLIFLSEMPLSLQYSKLSLLIPVIFCKGFFSNFIIYT